MSRTELDPFRIMISALMRRQGSDQLLGMVLATGLQFDVSLSEKEAYSNKTRVRVLAPRIIAAYDQLEEPATLGVANALAKGLTVDPEALREATEALQRVGWDIREGKLVATEPDLREMFFPRNSQWDAFVVLRVLFAEASTELTVVDAYCDHTLFGLLASRAERPLSVHLLCSKGAAALTAEGKTFASQYPGWKIEVRSAKEFHDRFVVLDGSTCIHIGASINGAGKTAFMMSRVEDETTRRPLLAAIESSWDGATPAP